MLSITSRLNFIRTLGLMMMLGIMLFFCTTYVYAGQVSLAWDANTESTLGGYQLHYGQTSGNYTTNVDVGNQTGYTFANLPDGPYYFAVSAYDTSKTNWSGYSNEVSKTISSTAAPIASFSANPTSGVAPLTVTFADTSTGTISSRYSTLGDGTTSTATSGAKTYSTPGTYPVSLTVTGPGGSSTATKTITASAAAPVANFTASPTSGTAPLAVNFTNSSTGNITSYSWKFGDGSSSTAQNPSHTYSSIGTYTVNLTATGPGGTHTRTDYITVSSVTGGGSPVGLVAAYNFEEASGTTVVDASGKGNHGTISGASRITSGQFGRALSFDGVNDWVTVNDAPSLDLTTGMTLEAWVYPTDSMTGWQAILNKESPAGYVNYYLSANSDTNLPATGVYVSGYQHVFGGSWLIPSTWTHLVATYDGNTQRLYVNGTEVAKRAQSGPIEVSNGSLRIGGASFWTNFFFKGRIDEVRIYNRALSAAEINTDRNTSVASSSPPISFIGTNTIGPLSDSLPAKQAYAFQSIAAKTGKMTSFSVYVDAGSAATDLVVGIYSNNNSHPYKLLGKGTLTKPTEGKWNNVVLPAISVTSGTQYWIAILSANTGTLRFRDAAAVTAQPSETSAQTTLTTLPSTWSTGQVYNEGPLSAYGAGYP